MTALASHRREFVTQGPKVPLAATVARLIFGRAAGMVPVRVTTPSGPAFGGGAADPSAPEFEIVRPRAFFARLGADAKIGFGEGYMAGDWRAGANTDLADLLTPFCSKLTTLVPAPLQRLRTLLDRRSPGIQENSLEGSRSNVAAHYDLSNDLFAQFLDPTMSYSSALFDTDHSGVGEDLEAAQLRKIDAVLDSAEVRQGSRVLEIGSGWGALAIRAAQRGAIVTSVTLSREQLTLAQQRVADAGLTGGVDLRLQDYREVEGQYDAIVSVEMLEAVGEQYWPTYFATIDRLLAPGGKVLIQAITMSHAQLLKTRRSFSWIHKYIFPGGIIPSLQAIDESLAAHTTLRVSGRRELGPHYAETLKRWRGRFMENWPQVQTLGFDDTFRRMWEFYLAYSEAGFRTGYLGVSQLQLSREPTWT